MKGRRRTAVILLSLACVVLVVYAVAGRPRLFRQAVGPPGADLPESAEGLPYDEVERRFVGHTEADVVERFGPPSKRWEGHFGMPPDWYRRKYPEAISAAYERPTGTLYLSFCKQDGGMVCFTAYWLRKGWAF
jgi:hypothetical protein